ncbi:TPA: hypothetical protein ACJF0N_001409 [Salmonella enterica subsp. enterica serovar Java]
MTVMDWIVRKKTVRCLIKKMKQRVQSFRFFQTDYKEPLGDDEVEWRAELAARRERKTIIMVIGILMCILSGLWFLPVPEGVYGEEAYYSNLDVVELRELDRLIAAIPDEFSRQIVRKWSVATQIAEFQCRPVALPVISRYWREDDPVDQVIMLKGKGDLFLINNRYLSGRGQMRTVSGWHDFSYQCELDPLTGRISRFEVNFGNAQTQQS